MAQTGGRPKRSSSCGDLDGPGGPCLPWYAAMEEGYVGEASWQGEASQLARKQTASFSLTRVRRASQVRQEKEAEALRPGAPAASPGASPARKVVRTSTFRKREASFVEELPKLKPVAKREWRDPPPPGPARACPAVRPRDRDRDRDRDRPGPTTTRPRPDPRSIPAELRPPRCERC